MYKNKIKGSVKKIIAASYEMPAGAEPMKDWTTLPRIAGDTLKKLAEQAK